MPAALEVDWNEVKTLALAIGVREAARRMGLPEDAVKKRSSREGWLRTQQPQERMELVKAEVKEERRVRQGLSPRVPTAAEVLSQMGEDTRSKLAVGLNKAARTVSEMDGQEVLMSAQQVQQLTKSAQVVHGWAGTVEHKLSLDVLASGQAQEHPVLDVAAETLTDEDGQ